MLVPNVGADIEALVEVESAVDCIEVTAPVVVVAVPDIVEAVNDDEVVVVYKDGGGPFSFCLVSILLCTRVTNF